MRQILVAMISVVSLAIAILHAAPVVAEEERLLVLDGIKAHGAFTSRVLVVDAHSGAIIAEQEAGDQAIMGLSPEGDVVGVISLEAIEGRAHRTRADFYRANDLAPLESGYLPVEPTPRQSSGGFLYFAPRGKGFIVQRMDAYLDESQPPPNSKSDCWLYHVERKLDDHGVFKLTGTGIKIPNCLGIEMLRVDDWPRAIAWKGGVPGLYEVDFDAQTITGRRGFFDDSLLQPFDPTLFGQQVDNDRARRRFNFGQIHTCDGRTGYYVPQHPRGNPPRTETGYLRKIDLTAEPPRLIVKSEKPIDQLRAATAAVTSRTLYVVRENIEGVRFMPSNRIRSYDVKDLVYLAEIQVPVADIQQLSANSDGTHLYALSAAEAKIAIIDAQSGSEIKVLEKVGKFPVMMFPLPSADGQ